MRRVQSLRESNPTLKVLLALGGAGRDNGGFVLAASTVANRRLFARNALRFLRDNGFDGLDLDWERPLPEQKVNYTLTLTVSKQAVWLTWVVWDGGGREGGDCVCLCVCVCVCVLSLIHI